MIHSINSFVVAVLAVAVSLSVGACQQSRAPDAGGDTALARDLAEVQLRGMQRTGDSSVPMAPGVGDSTVAPADTARRDSALVTVAVPTVGGTSHAATATVPVRAARTTSRAPKRPASRTDTSASGPCGSPSHASQQACLQAHLRLSDARLNRVYQTLITALRQKSKVSGKSSEPRMVAGLRDAQRSWLVVRDRECLKRTRGKEGRLWAPVRARCLAEFSAARADQLEAMLKAARGR